MVYGIRLLWILMTSGLIRFIINTVGWGFSQTCQIMSISNRSIITNNALAINRINLISCYLISEA